jgi:hypothetical protein
MVHQISPGGLTYLAQDFSLAYVSDVPLTYTSGHWPESAGKSPDAPPARTTANISKGIPPFFFFVPKNCSLIWEHSYADNRTWYRNSYGQNQTREVAIECLIPNVQIHLNSCRVFFVQLVAPNWVAQSRSQIGRKTFQRIK